MERNEQVAAAWKLLDQALKQVPAAESHPLDDEDFLFRMTTGRLNGEEQEELDAHLKTCQLCADVVHDLHEEGLMLDIKPREQATSTIQSVDLSQIRQLTVSRQQRRKPYLAPISVVIAAVCLIALIPLGRMIFDSQVGTVEFATMTTLSDFGLSPRQRSKSVEVLDLQKQKQIDQLQEAIDSDPDNDTFKLNLARLLFSVAQIDRAREILLQVNAASPDDPVVLNALGMIEFQRGQYSEAIRLFQLAQNDKALRVPSALNEADALLKTEGKNAAVNRLKRLADDSSLDSSSRNKVQDAIRELAVFGDN